MENFHLSIHMASWKESMINRLSNLIKRNRSAAKISQVYALVLRVSLLEHKTCDILAAERLRLMRFDNRLIIDSFQEAVCLLKW